MASAEQIADFKTRMGNAVTWSDETISVFLDSYIVDNEIADWDEVLAESWTRRAAETAALVDTSESGSSRSSSQIHKNALSMAKYYSDIVAAGEPVVSGLTARTRPIVRENGL